MAANSYTDSHLQLTAAALLGPGDCVIAVSQAVENLRKIKSVLGARRISGVAE